MKHLLIIHDIGDNWRITGTDIKPDDFIVDKNLYIEVGEYSYNRVNDLLVEYYLSYPKNMEFDPENIKKDLGDNTLVTRGNAIGKIKKDFEENFSVLDHFNFYRFTVLNTDLNSLGYYLTYSQKNNIQDILEKEKNEDIKNKIISFFEILEIIEKNMAKYDEMASKIDKIQNAQTKDEIEEIMRGR